VFEFLYIFKYTSASRKNNEMFFFVILLMLITLCEFYSYFGGIEQKKKSSFLKQYWKIPQFNCSEPIREKSPKIKQWKIDGTHRFCPLTVPQWWRSWFQTSRTFSVEYLWLSSSKVIDNLLLFFECFLLLS
jgi:hypothetical protein